MSAPRKEREDARTLRFFLERERSGWTMWVEIEPLLAATRDYMDEETARRFELAVRRAADEFRDSGAPARKRWWKP